MHNDPIQRLRLSNLTQVLHHRAETQPEDLAFTFLNEGDAPEQTRRYGELRDATCRIAHALRSKLPPGARAILLYAPGLDFIEAFYGCLAAHIIAVPVYPPDPGRLDRTLPRLQAIARDAAASAVLTSSALLHLVQPLAHLAPEFAQVHWITTDDLPDAGPWTPLHTPPEQLAYLQYTSGSTGTPKGVMISHGNLMANSAQIWRGFGHAEKHVGVGWLPTYHDMGLVGKVLQTNYFGGHTALMSPVAFLKRPARWLQAITRFGGMTSGGPNFAYDLCTRKITQDELNTLDLSSWRVAFCGAEPVRADTLDRFARRFEPAGFRREALFPCYGLAEATLYVAGGWLGQSATTRRADPDALLAHRVLDAEQQPATPLTTCGPVDPQIEIAIVHPERLEPLSDDAIGEIWLRGPNVALGYWRQPEATSHLFQAQLPGDDRTWLRTGDLGALTQGQLLITGRLKDMLIFHGRNHYPQDIEATVEAAHDAIRPGAVVACALQTPQGERLAVAAEIADHAHTDLQDVIDAIRAAVATHHELTTHRIALLPLRALPKTSSGKLQRNATAEALLNNALQIHLDWQPPQMTQKLYDLDTERFQRLEARNTRYRFDLDDDVRWDLTEARGDYFTRETLEFSGINVDLLKQDSALWETFQWALAVGICEEFVRLETRILDFLDQERSAGRLPHSRSADLFHEEEIKHVHLFQRYGDALRAQRPQLAQRLDQHLDDAFSRAWWANDRIEHYPSTQAYHFVNWLHFLFFEEYSIYLHEAMAQHDNIQPAWLTAHDAHRREEQQHVVTDQAYAEALLLSEDERRRWSLEFLLRCGADASGLAGLDGVWTFCVQHFPQLEELARAQRDLDNDLNRQRAFARLLQHKRAFARTCRAATALDDFEQHIAQRHATPTPTPPETHQAEPFAAWLANALAERLGEAAEHLDRDKPFPYFGLDSLAVVSLAADLETWLRQTRPWSGDLSPALLYEHYTVNLLAQKLADLTAHDHTTPHAAATPPAPAEDLQLDLSIFDQEHAEAQPRNVFVTGTTGFLMGYVLAELLQDPHLHATCLVRADSQAQAAQRIHDNLRHIGAWRDDLAQRIHPLPGDLARPLLGLTPEEFNKISSNIDEIYHGGAVVDFIQPYDLLKPANVLGTQEIIRLASKARVRALNLISTIAIFDTHDQVGLEPAREQDLPSGEQGFRNGYAQSKWAAERLVRMAQDKGLPVRVFRPGIVCGHTRTGHWQIDMVAAMLRGYITSRAAILPVAGGTLNAAPVDFVARAIAHIAQQPRTLGQTFHLTNPSPTPWSDVYTWMQRLGYPVEPIPYERWLEHLQQSTREGNDAAQPYLHYFKARPQAWQLRQPPFDTTNTQHALQSSNITCPPLSPTLLQRYFEHFQHIGFLPQAHQPATQAS